MNRGTITVLVAVGIVVFTLITFVGMYASYSNAEVRLRNQLKAQVEANKTSFDTCWKIIKQQAGVAEKHKDAFKEIYSGLMEGRHYEKGGNLLKFINEANPSFDSSLYQKVANSIEGQRTIFKRDQQKLIDLKREHDNLLTTIPSNFFVGSRDTIEIKVITSTATENTFESGKEDDVDLFD